MEDKCRQAYDSLVPADRLVIDAMIFTLANKDRELQKFATDVMKMKRDEMTVAVSRLRNTSRCDG